MRKARDLSGAGAGAGGDLAAAESDERRPRPGDYLLHNSDYKEAVQGNIQHHVLCIRYP